MFTGIYVGYRYPVETQRAPRLCVAANFLRNKPTMEHDEQHATQVQWYYAQAQPQPQAAPGASVLAGARLGWVTGGLLSNLGGVVLSRYVSYVSYMCILHVFHMCFDVTRSIYI